MLKQVVPIAVKAAFLNCGQNCASGERFIVHTKIYDKFVEAVKETAAAMRQGPTLGLGEKRYCTQPVNSLHQSGTVIWDEQARTHRFGCVL